MPPKMEILNTGPMEEFAWDFYPQDPSEKDSPGVTLSVT